MLDRCPRVILNDRVLFRPLTGVGHYARQLLEALRRETAADVTVCPFLAELLGLPEVAQPHGGPPAGPRRARGGLVPRPLLRVLDVPYRLALRLRAGAFDLYHEPNHIPVRCGVPTVTTVHDLSVLAHPEWHPADRVRWYEREFQRGLRQTARFIAASEFTRREMVARLGVAAERIDVTYQAARPGFTPVPGETAQTVCRRLGLEGGFFLFVGTLEPRKNVTGLLAAFAAVPAPLRRAHPLVLAGGWGWRSVDLEQRLEDPGLRADVRLIGYQPDGVLAALYSACTAMVWPTHYEGFGLPPLEALACGAAVIAGNTTSLPEVVGEAGLLLDPHDTGAWTAALCRVAEDAGWRGEWQRRGPGQAARFSWARCARQTVACYRAALGLPPVVDLPAVDVVPEGARGGS